MNNGKKNNDDWESVAQIDSLAKPLVEVNSDSKEDDSTSRRASQVSGHQPRMLGYDPNAVVLAIMDPGRSRSGASCPMSSKTTGKVKRVTVYAQGFGVLAGIVIVSAQAIMGVSTSPQEWAGLGIITYNFLRAGLDYTECLPKKNSIYTAIGGFVVPLAAGALDAILRTGAGETSFEVGPVFAGAVASTVLNVIPVAAQALSAPQQG